MTDILDTYELLDDADRCLIEEAVQASFDAFCRHGNVDIAICTQEAMRELNAASRGIDQVTDVLSFPAADAGEAPNDGFFGDIVICPSRAREQAAEYGHSYARELAFLTIHGMLHLFGFDHMEEEDDKTMRLAQAGILERMGLLR